MRVFVTGSTGFIGTAVVKELLTNGHQVLGLSRSEAGVKKLEAQGAEPLLGSIEDVELLKKATSECDAVIHLAFIHDFSQFVKSCEIDQAAVAAMGAVLAEAAANGKSPAFVITTGTGLLLRGKDGAPSDEDSAKDSSHFFAQTRGPVEPLCFSFADKGVRACVVRLPPTTHGPGSSGFMGPFIAASLDKGVAGYPGDGRNYWSAGHRDDAARLYRLAMEKGTPGRAYHAIGEQGIVVKDIAEEVGRRLGIPVESIPADKMQDHFGLMAPMVVFDSLASSVKTQKELGWSPKGPTALEDVPVIIDYIKSQKA